MGGTGGNAPKQNIFAWFSPLKESLTWRFTQENKAAVIIQKHWKGYSQRLDMKKLKRDHAKIKAKNAIQELEDLKKLAILEDIYQIPEIPRPYTNQTVTPKTDLPLKMKSFSFNNQDC